LLDPHKTPSHTISESYPPVGDFKDENYSFTKTITLLLERLGGNPMSRKAGANHRYGEDSPFVRLLGTPGRVRILDVFLRRYETELSANDISHLVSESTFSRNKDILLELDIIKQTRREGGKQYYALNRDSELVDAIGRFHTQLFDHLDAITERTEIFKEDYVGQLLTTKTPSKRVLEERDPELHQESKQRREVLASLGYMEGR
jgi:DNA-binding transcriptional ArsR family regulator